MGISSALDIPRGSVHSVSWGGTPQSLGGSLDGAGRRLQMAYALSYEVIVPSELEVGVVLQRAAALVLNGSGASQALKASLHSSGITMGTVHQMVAPRSFQQTVVKSSEGYVLPMPGATTTAPLATTTSDAENNEDSSSGVGAVVGSAISFPLGLAVGLLLYALWSHRQKKRVQDDVAPSSFMPVGP